MTVHKGGVVASMCSGCGNSPAPSSCTCINEEVHFFVRFYRRRKPGTPFGGGPKRITCHQVYFAKGKWRSINYVTYGYG